MTTLQQPAQTSNPPSQDQSLSVLESPTQTGRLDLTPVDLPTVNRVTNKQPVTAPVALVDQQGKLSYEGLQSLLNSKYSRFRDSHPRAGELNFDTRWKITHWATETNPGGYDREEVIFKRASAESSINQALQPENNNSNNNSAALAQALATAVDNLHHTIGEEILPGTGYTIRSAIRAEPIFMCDLVLQILAPKIGESCEKLFNTLRVFKEIVKGS